jgi:hypothetical protein
MYAFTNGVVRKQDVVQKKDAARQAMGYGSIQ